MSDIDYLKEQMQKLDEDRTRMTIEIEKRKHDIKIFGANLDPDILFIEEQKIRQLQDILENIEVCLDSCIAQIFDIATKQATCDDADDESDWDYTEDKEHERLVQILDKANEDLGKYKSRRKALQTELSVLEDLIEATEKEIDRVLSELIQYEE